MEQIQKEINKYTSYRFLAAPNPPGKITASHSLASSSLRGWILPRATLADSTKTFLNEHNNVCANSH